MLLQRSRRQCVNAFKQRGFTLLEVLVAMTLIGFGLAVAFTAVSGTARMDEKMTDHSAAMALARSKLDEALANSQFVLANDYGEDHYSGTDFGYRIQLRPVPILSPEQHVRIRTFKRKLEKIDIEVFWGSKDARQSYTLSSYRVSPLETNSAAINSDVARP